jgi:DNA mismatch endonuclease (patch repair protein)
VTKLEGNAERDRKHLRSLRKLGWRVLVVWECETERNGFARRLRGLLAKEGIGG